MEFLIPDLLFLVFDNLTLSKLIQIRQVCKRWQKLIDSKYNNKEDLILLDGQDWKYFIFENKDTYFKSNSFETAPRIMSKENNWTFGEIIPFFDRNRFITKDYCWIATSPQDNSFFNLDYQNGENIIYISRDCPYTYESYSMKFSFSGNEFKIMKLLVDLSKMIS